MTLLRNLNVSVSGRRVCGIHTLGVVGSLIPSTGDAGPGYTYNDLSLPADAAKHICGRITTWPATGEFFAFEDTSFTFIPAGEGTEYAQYQLEVDGDDVGSPATIELNSGASGTTVTGILGAAAANGSTAGIAINVTVGGTVGAGSADGAAATISQGSTINATEGSATADGLTATIDNGGTTTTISATVGAAVATGSTASVAAGSAHISAFTRYTISSVDRTYTISRNA